MWCWWGASGRGATTDRWRSAAATVAGVRSSLVKRTLTTNGRRLVLGIETSCDDTCAAVVSAPESYPVGRATIHSSVVRKQDHSQTNGIEPLRATHYHSATLPPTIVEALRNANADGALHDVARPSEIDAIAVTQGPGMSSCLAQGLSMAKLLSALWNKPLVYVHHMVAHTLTPLLTAESDGEKQIKPPFLVLLVSGGHTQFVLSESYAQFKILARTTDNSIGDAFDKVARELKIECDWATQAPGAALESFARLPKDEQMASAYKMTIPNRTKPTFSFSGYISAIKRLVETQDERVQTQDGRRAFAYAFQRDAFAQVQDKLALILRGALPLPIDTSDIHHLVVSGGVASNAMLRQMLQQTLVKLNRNDVQLHFPPAALCTDNAAMIAHAALVHWRPTYDLTASPRSGWSVEQFVV